MSGDQIQAYDNAQRNAVSLPTTHHPLPTKTAALYIHWPFCRKKCPYCDFNSHVREGVDHTAWRAALLREMGYWHARAEKRPITSIFFGGGTPSLMEPATVAALIEEADKLWGLDKDCEITLEANPTSVEASKFVDLRAAGVNRVSLGVQSLRPESLKFLGREHSADEALAAVALAAKIFDRYSFDLIYALPNQTLAEWEKELKEALNHARGHLSLYQLTIEENTAFHHAYHVGKSFQLPEDSLAAELYTRTQEIMESVSLPAYEISNHASPGQESRHNLTYWRSGAYIGIGPGAHGRVDLLDGVQAPIPPALRGGSGWNPTQRRITTRTLKSPERWLAAVQLAGHGVEEEATLTREERAEEAVLMGLRLRGGIALAALAPYLRDTLEKRWADGRLTNLENQGFIEVSPSHIRATPRGRLLLNRLVAELLQ